MAGRPSCTGGTRHLVALVKTGKPVTVAIVADNDPAGTSGASTTGWSGFGRGVPEGTVIRSSTSPPELIRRTLIPSPAGILGGARGAGTRQGDDKCR